MKFQKILITGGSRGIGKSLVDQFLKDNCEVHVVSRNFKNKPKNPKLLFHPFDLTKTKSISIFCEDFILNHGVPDLLINNAGSGAFYEWATFPESEIVDQMNLLFLSPVLFCRKFVPAMVEEGIGMIVNISSLATLYPVPNMPLYNASKSALSTFTMSMMLEYENPQFIDVILGDVKTEFNDKAALGDISKYQKKTLNSWRRVRKQLDHSPTASEVIRDIIHQINKRKSQVIYGGGFFHKAILPMLHRFVPKSLLIKTLQKYYGI